MAAPGRRQLRLIVLIACAIQFIDVAMISALSPLLPHFREELGFGPSESGRLVASFAIGSFMLAFPAGALVGRFGVKATAVVGLALMAATSAAFGLADSTHALEAARFGQGAASSVAWTAGISWLTGSAPPDRRGRYLGWQATATVSGALAGPGFGVLGAHVGTRATFVGLGAAIAVLAVIALALPTVPAARQSYRAAFRALRNPTLSVGVGLFLLPALLMGVQNTVAPLRLSDAGWGVSAIGSIFIAAAAIQAVWNPLFGRWLDRVDPRTPIGLSLSLSAALACLLALPWLDGHWALAVLVGAASIAFVSFYLLGSTLIARGADATGLEHAYGFSLANAAWAPGTIVGSLVGGAVAQGLGGNAPYALLAALCLGFLVAVRWLPISAPTGAVARAS
ncbi:MAG: MFS transporter [Gaiellales bacterium]